MAAAATTAAWVAMAAPAWVDASATAVANGQLGSSERDGEGEDGGDELGEGLGGGGMRRG